MDMINKYWAAQALALDIEMLQCESALSAISIESEANAKRAELKVMCENGTYDDLFELYREASEEASDKKKNIFVRMIEGICNFVRNLADKVAKLFKKAPGDKNKQIEVPYAKETPGKIQKASNAIGGLIDKALHGSVNVPDIAKLGGAILGVAALPIGVKELINRAKRAKNESNDLDNKNNSDSETSTTTVGQAENDCNMMQKCINGVSSKLKALGEKFKKSGSTPATPADNQANQNDSSDSGDKESTGGDGQKDGLIKQVIDIAGGFVKAVGQKISAIISKIFGKGGEKKETSDNDQPNTSGFSEDELQGNNYNLGEHGDDTIDVSEDDGMAAFEAALNAIVYGDEETVTESSAETSEISADDSEPETSEEEEAAFESVAAEFDALFGDEEDE
nr:MAG TPA: hypothetical protein [Caudoviricetes sp.]